MMVALPLISFGLTVMAIPLAIATGLVPRELLGQVNFPAWVFRAPILGAVAGFINSITNLWLGVLVFFIILLLLGGIGSLIYVAALQVIGPPRYSEMDAPPTGHKPKAYKR